MKKPKTYKTGHPTIKEITIGDKFITEDGETVTFVRYYPYNNMKYPFLMKDKYSLPYVFPYGLIHINPNYSIKHKCITLKDKINSL